MTKLIIYFRSFTEALNKEGLSASSTHPTFYLPIACVHITVNTLIFIYLFIYFIGVLALAFYSSAINRVHYSGVTNVQTSATLHDNINVVRKVSYFCGR